MVRRWQLINWIRISYKEVFKANHNQDPKVLSLQGMPDQIIATLHYSPEQREA